MEVLVLLHSCCLGTGSSKSCQQNATDIPIHSNIHKYINIYIYTFQYLPFKSEFGKHVSVLCLEMDKHAGETERSSWCFAWVRPSHCNSWVPFTSNQPSISPPQKLSMDDNQSCNYTYIMLKDLHIVLHHGKQLFLYVIFWRLLDGLDDLMSLIDQEGSGMLKNLG